MTKYTDTKTTESSDIYGHHELIGLLFIRRRTLCEHRHVLVLEKSLRRLITGREYNHDSVEGMTNYCSPGRAHVCPISQPASITLYYLGNAPDTLSRSLSRPRFLLFPALSILISFHLPPTSFIFLPPLIFQSTTNLQLVSEVTEVVLSLLMPALAFLCQHPDLFYAGRNPAGQDTFSPRRPRCLLFLSHPRRRCCLCGI